ncbi:STAS domain-containing protein [Streptomyces sp. S1A1-7]|uniref:STAS domain-containing protein n=1 Tax=Streptomyces sp. S1A1-7 TaxID=2594459 RepID=UPI0031FD15EA
MLTAHPTLRGGWCAGKSGRRRIRRARKACRAAQAPSPPSRPDHRPAAGRAGFRQGASRPQETPESVRPGPSVMEVDLGKVTYLAPEVRGLLLAAAASARRSGACFVITRASPLSLRVLEELGMRRLTDAPLPPGP